MAKSALLLLREFCLWDYCAALHSCRWIGRELMSKMHLHVFGRPHVPLHVFLSPCCASLSGCCYVFVRISYRRLELRIPVLQSYRIVWWTHFCSWQIYPTRKLSTYASWLVYGVLSNLTSPLWVTFVCKRVWQLAFPLDFRAVLVSFSSFFHRIFG